MNKKSIFFQTFLTTVFCVFFLAELSIAQTTKPSKSQAPYCDTEIIRVKNELQKQANSDCETQKTCIPCLERKSHIEICAVVVVQPTCKGAAAVKQAAATATPERMAATSKKKSFQVEILQKLCSQGKVSLEAFIPGYSDQPHTGKEEYVIDWFVDNKPAGLGPLMTCVSGKEVKVKVTHRPTKQVVEKIITLADATGGEPPYMVAGFQKTACFGTCPVYEVKFFSDGYVTWNGRLNVDRLGKYDAKVDPAVLKRIKDKANEVNYLDFEYEYPVGQTVYDAASTITYLRMGDVEKMVKNTLDAPAKLEEYEDMLEGLINNLAWKPVRD